MISKVLSLQRLYHLVPKLVNFNPLWRIQLQKMNNKMKNKIKMKQHKDSKETIDKINPKDQILPNNDKLKFLSNLIQYFISNN